MDGRSHPEKLDPSAYGHSVGYWEKDTLVVDSKGFSENFWIDRTGLPHTEQLHTVERFTRIDFNTIKYEVLMMILRFIPNLEWRLRSALEPRHGTV